MAKQTSLRADQDSPWKLILRRYFREAMEFFFPDIAKAIDWTKPIEFLDKKFQKITPGSALRFDFTSVKLLDYQSQWTHLEQSNNPFAIVVMAHLKTQETTRATQKRKNWKFILVKRLYEEGYSRSDVLNLFKFIDWLMILPEGLKQTFWQELRAYEEERQMPYITSIEQIGYDRGLKAGEEKGLEKGLEKGQRSLILKLLPRKVGPLPQPILDRIHALSIAQLESLGEDLLDFSSIEQLTDWLQNNS
jgi:Domain of unknown function (DUF4351)